MTTYHAQARPMLEQMLAWYVGCATDFSISCGKSNKFFRNCLPQPLYQRYTQIYCDSNYEHMWQAIRIACGLFHDAAKDVGAQLGFSYPQADEDGFSSTWPSSSAPCAKQILAVRFDSLEKKVHLSYNQTVLEGRLCL